MDTISPSGWILRKFRSAAWTAAG